MLQWFANSFVPLFLSFYLIMYSFPFILFVYLVTMVSSIETHAVSTITKWEFDKAHSSISFKIRHYFTPITGHFNSYDGLIYFDATNLKESSIDVKIDVKSIDTKNDKRDSHLQTADFFEAEKFPFIRFKSTEIVKKNNSEFVAKGKLTIKDVVTDFDLPFTLLGIMDHPRKKGTKISAFEANFMINRNDYHVGTGQYVETAVIGDEVNINITLELLSSN